MSYYELSFKVKSPLEKRFLEDCVTVGLKVVPQYPIENIHADFAIPEKKFVIELDSKQWHSSEDIWEKDWARDDIYWKNGWRVIRITGKYVYQHGEEVAEVIKQLDPNDDSWSIKMYGDFDEWNEIT